jgi:DNA-binding beta-propeller fold protein YncE
MVLLHGGTRKGAERIAACWADNRKVPQVAFKPDGTRAYVINAFGDSVSVVNIAGAGLNVELDAVFFHSDVPGDLNVFELDRGLTKAPTACHQDQTERANR